MNGKKLKFGGLTIAAFVVAMIEWEEKTMKKMITLMVILLTLVSGAFAAAWTGSTSKPQWTTKKDGELFYVIKTAEELAWFAAQVNEAYSWGKVSINAVLANDIVFGSSTTETSTVNWTPIGKDSLHRFAGTFDGAGFTIYGLYGLYDKDKAYVGLFGVTDSSGIVKNINSRVGNFTIHGANNNTGFFVGINNGQLINCINYSTITASSGSAANIGGLVGRNNGTISGSSNYGEVTFNGANGSVYVGGICGTNYGFVSDNMNSGAIFASGEYGRISAGGIVGENWSYIIGGSKKNRGVSSSINYGSVTTSILSNGEQNAYAYSGGITGFNASSISKCYNTGSIFASSLTSHPVSSVGRGGVWAGGIAGENGSNISNCYNSGSFTTEIESTLGTSYEGGIAGQALGTIKTSYCSKSMKYWMNDDAVVSTSTDMQSDQFAWILNTKNGTTPNSEVWSRTSGYPIFATSTNKPIFKVVFKDNGSTSDRYSTSKGSVSFPSNPTPATGYFFDGWYKGTTKVTPSTVFTADTTVSAKYLDVTTLTFQVKFYNDDKKKLLDIQSVGYGKIPVYSGAIPFKADSAQFTYRFSKWDRILEATYQDTSYYAVYTSMVKVCEVKFLDYDGTVLKKDSYEYGSIPVYGSAVSREATAEWNYEFIGWTPAIGNVIKATNYTATYDSTKVKYEVVFMNGNAEIDVQEVEYGSTAEKPADPKKAGFTFVGWNKDFSNVTENLVVEAMFEENIVSSSSEEQESSSSTENLNSSSSAIPNSSSSSSSEKVENSSSSEEAVVSSSSKKSESSSSGAVIPAGFIDDIEDGNNETYTGGFWFTYNDAGDKGESTISNEKDKYGGYVVVFPGSNGTEGMVGLKDINLVQGGNEYEPYVALGLFLKNEDKAYDLSSCKAISYDYIGAAHHFQAILAGDISGKLTKYNRHSTEVSASTSWTTANIAWSDLLQATGWGTKVSLNKALVSAFHWEVKGEATPDYLYVDNFKCDGLKITTSTPSSSSFAKPTSSSSQRPTIVANTVLKGVSVTIVNKNLQISGAIVDVDVFDLQGRLLKTLRNVQGSVNFSTMPSGNYIIRISSGAQNFTRHISLK